MPYASAQGPRVYYELHGSGPALVLVHGSGGHHAIWYQQIAHFRDRYTVVAIDLPGFGLSDSDLEEYDAATTFVDAILAVLDDAGVDKAILVGQSLGCLPILALTVRYPDRVAAAVMCHSVRAVSDPDIQVLVKADRAAADQLPVLDRLLTPGFQLEDPAKVLLFRQMNTFNRVKGAAVKRDPNASTDEIRAAIAAGVFVCFVQGSEDAVVRPATYARLRELLPEAHIETVEGAPHSLYWEAPEVFNTTLDSVLTRIPALDPEEVV